MMWDDLYAAYRQPADKWTEASMPQEKRTTPRFLDGQMTYLFPLSGPSQIIEIADAGAEGLGLTCRTPLAPGSRHWLQILYRNGARRRFLIKILYSHETVAGRYHCGARLVSLDQADRIHWNSYQSFVRHRATATAATG